MRTRDGLCVKVQEIREDLYTVRFYVFSFTLQSGGRYSLFQITKQKSLLNPSIERLTVSLCSSEQS